MKELNERVAAILTGNPGFDIGLAIGQLLSIDAAESKRQSQRTTLIEDDTDLEALSEFNYSEYLQSRGIDTLPDSAPDSIILRELKKKFVVPVVENVSLEGDLVIELSDPIEPPSFDSLLFYLLKSKEVTEKQARRLQGSETTSVTEDIATLQEQSEKDENTG